MYNNTESDETLIEQVKKGECEAFNPLVERYKLSLYRLMYRMVFNRDDAEDLVEEAFIKAYRSISRFEIGRSFYAWLARIAVNNAINYKKKTHNVKLEPIEWVEHSLTNGKNDPVEMTEEKLLKEKINIAMAKLPPEFRAILILRVEENLCYDEISSILKIPKGTVMSRLARARHKLKELFEEKGVH